MIREDIRGAFKDSIIKGRYNLLLGAGVCLDSQNSSGDNLPSAESLRKDLCTVTGAPVNTAINRVAGLLNDNQRQEQLTKRFSGCRPGASLCNLPYYLWRRLFTFNIDDVLENLYTQGAKQKLVPMNFDSAFEATPDKSELLAIHLHGWVHQPAAGYVFSTSEYVRVMKGLNPWMHLLSEILSTEPFIIAGTSLNEVDLEYYLSFRSENTPRRDRGPSILVQPNTDVVTEADCKRYGLELFSGTFGQFLDWLRSEIPAPPTVYDLVVTDDRTLFNPLPSPQELVAFFSDFEFIRAAELDLPATPTGFLYGREPSWAEIDSHIDIERVDNGRLLGKIRSMLDDTSEKRNAIILLDGAGTGKTTSARRAAHDLVQGGIPVLSASTTSRMDTDVVTRCLGRLENKIVVLVDGIADHAEQVSQIFDDPEVRAKVVLLGTERGYRSDYLNVVFGNSDVEFLRYKKPTTTELSQLLERYRKFGLVGTNTAIQRPADFVSRLSGDPMAVAICRIMNDFKPLADIIKSLWNESSSQDRHLYLCVALSEYCIKSGLNYSLLQRIAGPSQSIAHLFEFDTPLGIAHNIMDDEYVLASNGVIAEQILFRAARHDKDVLETTFKAISTALAPHVNRKEIMRRSPEARLAGRIFDCDKVVKPLLGDAAERFYIEIQHQWEWNSRYWEQRALMTAETDIDTAIAYARHAVAIELHSYPLTTLGKILLMQMETVSAKREVAYSEAVTHLIKAIEREYRRSRISIHPYATLLSGTSKYLELGGVLTPEQDNKIESYLEEARIRFSGDAQMNNVIERLDGLL